MSIKVTSAVWDHSGARDSDLLVLLYISDRCNDDGIGAYPSVARIAKACRLSERAAQYAIQSLVKSGELSVNLNAGPKRCNAYTINIALLGGSRICTGAEFAGCNPRQKRVHAVAPNTSVEPSPTISTPNVVEIVGPTPEPKPKRATRLPDGWTPDPAIADRFAFSTETLVRELDKFRDYYTAHGKTMVDWSAAWRSWLRKVSEYAPRPGNGRYDKFAASGQKLLTSADLRRMAQGADHDPERDAGVVVDSQFRVAEPSDHRRHGDGVDLGLRGRALPGGR